MQLKSKAALFSKVGHPLEIIEHEFSDKMEPGAILCKVIMSTICGSDLHTITGRRNEPTPLILGHEIIGEIVAMGDGISTDGFGDRINPGDRISWTIMASCGTCFFCKNDLPQKCVKLRKYGHTCYNEPPCLTGGYAEYIILFPGTTVFKVPPVLSDETATPANCALSTVVNAVESIDLKSDETVLIQGAGLLGLNLVALAAEAGAKKIFISDVIQSRLDLAKQFGADICLNLKEMTPEQIDQQIRDHTGGYGVDVAFEVCGVKSVVKQAVQSLRIGGRYLIAGLVTPGSDLEIDGNQLTRKYLTVKGIHNYHPKHLGMALQFLEKYAKKYPFDQLVGKVFPLSGINDAIAMAETGKYTRIAIKP